MKNARNNGQKRVKNCLKWTASGLLLALMFVLVFAGTLSGAFGIENELQQNGIIQSNVASAAVAFSAPSGAATGTIDFLDNQQNINNYLEKVLENDDDIANNWGWNSANRTGNGKTYTHGSTYGIYQKSDRGTIEAIVYVAVKLNLSSSKYYTVTSSAMVSLWVEGGGSADVSAQATTVINGSSNTPSFTYPIAQASSSLTTLVTSESGSHGAHISVTGKNSQAFGSDWINSNAKITSANSVVVKGNATVYLFAMLRSTYNRNTATTSRACFLDSISFAAEEMPPFDKGSGTLSDPFLLEKRADFDKLSSYVLDGNTFSDVYFKIQPDTSVTGQSNGKTIAMGGTHFTPIGNSTTKFAGTLLGNGYTINGLVTNGQYSGLFGYVNNARIDSLTVNVSNDSGNTSAGGLVGVVNGTTTITNCNVTGSVKGTHQIGGFVGYAQDCVLTISNGNNSAAITTTGQDSNDKGRTSGGGIVGYVKANSTVTINDVTNTGKVETTSSKANSGLGGIVGFANGGTNINNCHNTASITGHAGLGGIVGYTASGTIVGCRNDGNITSSKAYDLGADSASYSGGIAGYCYADVAKCYNSGTVKTTSDWANSNQVAGIAAYLGSGRNVKYCYNEGQIEGSDYVGGIVGKRAGTVSYSYQAGKIKGLYKKTSTIGHITGSDSSKISTCWTLPSAKNLTTVTNTFNHNGYTVNSEANVAMKPAFGNAVLGGWDDITVTGVTSGTFSEITGIDQFVFYPNNGEHTIANNQYLFVYAMDANAVALVPNHIDSGVEAINGSTTASVAKTVPFISRFFFNANRNINLVASISPIDAPLTSTQTVYNGSGQKVTTDVVGADVQEKSYYFTSGNDNALAKSEFIDAGMYDIVTEVTMKVGENTYVVVGRQVHETKWTIATRKIRFWNKIYYYGDTPTNAPVPQSMSGDEGLLNEHTFICTHANDLTYDFMYGAIPNAQKEVTINMTGEIRDAAGNDVTYNYDFQNGTFTISMREGNFGVKGTTDIVNNPWGSQGNPFVIKNAQHLVNLSKIVNGETPANADSSNIVNSVFDSNNYTHVVSNNTRTYTNCYFIIVNDLDMNGSGFAPIGKDATYFFEGNVSGVKSIEDTSQQNRSISNLTVNLASTDNVGLFGYVLKKGTQKPYIKHIVLNNSCSFVGKSNVGSIVGWAQDAVIQNCINNATVEGKGENAGGIVGKNFGTETSNCENHGTVKGVKNVGGIAGTLDWGVISNVQNHNRVEASGENCGGIVGYMISYSTLKNVTNNAQVNGGNKTGGVLGYYEKKATDSVKPIYGLTNNKPVEGLSNVGGIIGCVAGNLTFDGNNESQKCTMSGGSVKGTFNVGGLVGGVEDGSTVTLKNFTNNAKVIGGYVVGGLVGLLRGSITNSVNNADITSEYNKAGTPSGLSIGAYVGGLVGVAYGAISHCYNSGNISASGDNSDFLGGIVGYTNANVAYCTSLENSIISGSNQVGGIVGNLQNATIDYCYFNGKIVGIWNNATAKLDFICGEITGGSVSNSWKLPKANNGDKGNRTYTNAGNALTIATGVTFKPYFVQEGSEHDTEWEQIVSKNIVGFSVSGNVPTNSYFNSDNGNDTAYVKPDKTNGFAANSTSGNVTAWYGADFGRDVRCSIVEIQVDTTPDEYNGKPQGLTREDVYMPSANNGVYAVQFAYRGNKYGDTVPEDVDVYNTTVTVKIDEKVVGVRTGVQYEITKKKVTITNVWTWKFVDGSNADFYKFEYNKDIQGMLSITVDGVLENSHYTLTQTENKAAVGKYSSSVVISDRDYDVEIVSKYCTIQNNNANLKTDNAKYGIKTTQTNANTPDSQTTYTYNWEIVPFDLAANISNVWFGGTTNLIVGNQAIANVKVGNANKGYYPLQADKKGAPGVQQVLVYAQHNYAASSFVLYVKYNNGNVVPLTRDTEYTVGTLDTSTNTFGTFNVNVVSQANPVEDTNVTARGTGNFSGIVTKYYTALYSDFGWKDGKTPEDNDWGGSADNPYVISKPEHLLRLSQIVNGGTAWNSIITTNNALCISPQGTAVATDRAYSGAYFLVIADIDMTGNVSTDGVYNFLPIGHRNEQSQTDMPFSGTFDGNGKAITFVYNTENFGNGARVDYVGLFGYLNGATVTDLIAKSIQVNGIKGRNYVGGIVGYAENSHLVNVQKSYGDGVVGENYVGGVVGYAENTLISCNNDTIAECNVTGAEYVGGIVGKWIVTEQTQIGGSDDGQARITPGGRNHIIGTKYVGGLFGWLDMSGCEQSMIFKPQFFNEGLPLSVTGTEYVGALFGVLIGNGYHQSATLGKYTAIVISDQKVNNITLQTNTSAKVVGGLVGYAESVGILFETDWNTSSTTFTLDDSTSFFGGVVGVLGKNSTIEAIIVTKEGDGSYLTGSEHTILNNTALGASGKPIGSFVGGIVGYVSSQAGTYWEANTTIFGNGISLVNSGQIHATGYAGGIFGALGDISESVAQTFENDTNSILYKVLTTGVRSGNANTTLGIAPTVDSAYFTGAKGKLVNNASLSVTGGYVGGIAGYSGAKVRFVLRNTPQTGAIATANLNVYSGGNDIYINGSYAGGIAGYLVDNLEHELQYIVVQAKFDSANAKRVGGLVGYMGSGKVENCVVTNGGNSNVNELTDTFKGSEYVGGLVGETQNAIITNSVSTGFNLDKTTNTKGGLLGGGTNPTIESSWTFYIANSGATYQTVSKNTYGKYILVDTAIVTTNGSSYPTFAKLCEFAGITENGTAGVLEFDVNMPRYDLNANLNNKQLAFYDASGSDTVSTNFDSGAVNGFENKVKEIENINNVVTTKLDMASGTSMQICVVKIEFVNISKWNSTNPLYNTADGAQQNVENAYKKPSNSSRYVVDVTNNNDGTIATNPKRIYDDDGNTRYILANVYFNWQATDGTVRFVPIGSSNADYVSDRIGTYDSEDITPGSSAENPLTISNQKEWNDFAWSIYTGTNDYAGQYVKLLTNDIVINTGTHYGTASSTVPLDFSIECTPNAYNSDTKNAKSNLGYNFAGNISQGSSEVEKVTVDGVQGETTPSFKGHFDGNGNTIEITYTSGGYHRISVFPNASNATFQNLTIKGTIVAGTNTSNSGYDIAAFVGKPFGAITFTNCTAAVDIQGLRVIAGFSGYSSSTSPITLIGCVNKGNITSYEGSEWTKNPLQDIGYPKDYSYGTGGLIAYATNDITIDSCLNTGNVVGQTKVGGLVGRVTAFTTIQNSANTGNITGEETNPYNDTDPKNKAGNAWSRVGGLVGEASKTATLKMYACYNTGAIRGKSNIAGGLVGILGTIPSNEKPHSTEANNTSTIAYCYNTGEVTVGWDKFSGIVMIGGSGYNFNGTDAGGLVGVAVKLNIEYSYNTGDIHGYGGVGYRFSWQVRNGGILAEACTNASNHSITIANCYSTGRIYIEENNGTSNTRYSADIIGYMDGEAGNDSGVSKVTVSDCYGIAKNIVSYEKNNIKYFSGWNNQSGGNVKYVRTGTTLNSLSDLTAIMRADGSVKPRAFYYANNQNNEVELWNASTSTIGAQNTTDYQNGTLGGYVYVYGCLPQLAVFAVDTYNGLSMNSQNFGKDIYGEYKAQKAGEEYSPYVIRDGIDLMGVQTLVGLGYTFDGKYIEFANGSNNITLDKNLSFDVAKAINMPISNSTSTKIADSENAYKSLGKDNTYHIGKSYHLFKLSAVCYDDNNIAQNTAYGYWLSSNHYYNGAYGEKEGAYKNYGTFKTQNILTIGRNGKVFKGSISGKQENNANTVINNLRITSGQTIGGAYGGLFGHVENAYIGYIEVGGESNIWAYSSDNQQIAATGAIAGYVTGDSIIEHCAVSGTTAIGAYGKNDDTHIASDITYAGGIVGLVNPKKGTQYEAGISAIIKDCTVNISTTTGDRAAFAGIIQACKSNIGGVLGYVGGDAGANEKGNSVRIEGCEVQKAAIQAANSAKTSSHIGGVLGYGSEYVAAFITGCKVGNGADTVTIKGEHSLGGIAGGMSNAKGGYIDSCIVGEKATIERINQGGGTVSENPKHGTAIGGLVGFTEGSTDTISPLTTTFSGTSAFSGKINVTVGTTNPGEHGDKKPVGNVGGIVGDMGSGANFASGSEVEVRGNIKVTLEAANIGGVAGRTNTATFIGTFDVSPTMNTLQAENVGGFIGKNVGTVYILADTTERIVDGELNGTNITIGGTISGTSEVGGFIGVNNSGSSLNIGSNVANAKPYKSGTLSITIAEGAEISGSGNHVGGIVGKNEGVSQAEQNDYATIDIVKGTIVQNGTISGKNYVGGIIGLNQGLLTTGGGEADTSIGGTTLTDAQIDSIKNLSITNNGNVTGSGNYVGGVVGKLDSPAEDSGKGAIAGTFTNSGTVVGNNFVGGSLGFVGKNVTITAKNNVATLFVNDGEVNATGYFVGGSIGALVGKIQGENSSVAVKFENKKKVNATGYVGGSIGVLAGPVSYAQFVNSSDGLEIAAVNSVGGSVGYIGVPSSLSNELVGFTAHQIDINNTHFEASGTLKANPSQDAINAAKEDKEDNGWGGVGGAIGVMGAAIKSWTDNTYYANGNVSANGIYNVGGIVGLINAGNITISNMLAYRTTVTGGKNVGGIVGATTGAKTVINSAYAIEGTFSATSATKGAGDNVGGIIGLAKDDTDASTSYWVKGYANSDIATYDVKDLSKLGFTTGKATTGWFFLYANDATGANGLGTINTNHQGGGEIELKYWKRIANAYTASERQTKIKDETGVEYTLATIPLKSDIVKDKDINGTDTKSPQKSTLYATATAAEVTEKGYYMYTATSNNDVKPSVIYDNGVYYISVKTNVINAEDEKVQAQNVAVFYRSVSSSKEALIYNGYLRNAIIGLDGVDLYENPIGDNETPTINGYKGQYIFTATTTIKNDDGSTTEVNEAQSDPNTYVSIVKIYYVDDNSKARLVGGNTGLGWKISERELAVAFEHTTNRTYGTGTEDNTTDMTVTIDNIAPKRGVTVPIRIVVSYGAQEDSRVIFTWDGTKFNGADENIKLTSIPMTQSGTLSDKDKESTSETIEDEATYQLVVKLFFKQAKSYTITVLDSSQKARYTFKKNGGSSSAEVSDEFTVLPAELRLVSSYATSSAYDGTYKGKEWLVTGFKYNDGILQFAEFGPLFNIKYKNGDVTTKAMTADNMTTGVDFNGPRVSVAGPSNGNLTISLANAINKGEYYLTFGKIAAGNYTLKIEDYSFSIVEIQIEISCDDNGKSKIYDGNAKDVKFTFKASAPAGVTFDGISEYKTFISKFFKINNQTIETNSLKLVDNKTITLTLQTEKDAATYKFVFGKGEKYDDHIKNCALKPATLPTYTYTITKRSITLSTTPTSTKTYIYNTEHQGLSQVKLNGESGDVGIVSGDTVMVKVSVPGGDPSSKTLSFDNQTLEVTAGISTINANQYVASFDLDDASSKKNYTLSATNVTWTIDKYKITVGEFDIGANKTYNAKAEVPKINVTNSEVSVSGTTFTYGTDTFTLEYAVSYNNQTYASNNLVNAGTYKIKIGTSSGKIHAKHNDGKDASNNYEFGNNAKEHTYVINPCEIKIGWEKKTFVYNASNRKLNVASIEINNTTKTVTNNRVQTGLGNDTLTFSRGGGGIDVGSYTTKVSSHSVSGEPNDGVRPIADNYKIVSGATSGEFEITPSKLKIVYADGKTSKVYDATTTVKDNNFTFTVSSTNFGANGKVDMFTITKAYDNKNVSNGYTKTVNFKYSFTSTDKNYEFDTTAQTEQSISNIGQITPAHIKVALDKLRSGKATRTFTNDERYGGNGASGNNRSQIYRAGEGFTVGGVLGSDNIVVTASYREALDSRNGTGNSFDLSKYVNDVEKNENTFTKVASGTYYKTLVFNLTGDDAANYTFNIYRGENKFGENDSTASASQNITVYDSRDKASGHQNASGAEQIKIEITVKSVRVEYSNTAQSYANDDNSYNKDWLRVTGTNKDMQGAGAEIVVTNGWMYQDGKDRPADSTDPKREYHGYTTIRGSQNSERLGAAVSKVNGMDLNYRLSNQPVLTIAYFVADGGEYKIDSLARLLIASFYYTAHQSPGDLEIVKIVSSGYQWVTVVSNDKYEKNEEIPAGFETWDAYFAKLKDDGYEVFLNVEEIKDGDVTIPANTWGYYQSTSNTDAALPTSYKLAKDISGKFTQSDIAILNTFFTVTTVGDDGHSTQTEYTWSGANSDYLKNVLSAAVDKVATINGSLFVSQKAEGAAAITGFDGTFDGNGYVIEYLNIMGYDKENVGLFDVIGANGIVKNLHLRNITINANKGNVGGIAGSIAAAEGDVTNVTNVSFHGKITATGGTVGGLFGTSARAIDGAIVLGEISASGANVGGVVGTATADLTKVVSMMQITANGGTVGAFTSDNANIGEKCTHMTNAVWKRPTSDTGLTSGTGFVNVGGKNVDYNALMSGSNSLYANAASALDPTYDVINEEFADSGQNVNPRQSKRLRDMVSVYLLMYSLSANGDKYTISASSWLVGTADGTTANQIVIANKQNVSLLRELRFATFTLKANVSIDIASTFGGAFYGSVTSAVNESGVSYGYKITCNKPMFEAYATEPPAWLVTPTQP